MDGYVIQSHVHIFDLKIEMKGGDEPFSTLFAFSIFLCLVLLNAFLSSMHFSITSFVGP